MTTFREKTITNITNRNVQSLHQEERGIPDSKRNRKALNKKYDKENKEKRSTVLLNVEIISKERERENKARDDEKEGGR